MPVHQLGDQGDVERAPAVAGCDQVQARFDRDQAKGYYGQRAPLTDVPPPRRRQPHPATWLIPANLARYLRDPAGVWDVG
jgi:hypothetical protein